MCLSYVQVEMCAHLPHGTSQQPSPKTQPSKGVSRLSRSRKTDLPVVQNGAAIANATSATVVPTGPGSAPIPTSQPPSSDHFAQLISSITFNAQ
jgi:hypothetical protein